MNFIGYIIIYISIIFGSIYISDQFNKKIESSIIIDILLKITILYVLGLLNQLQIGVIILNIVPILLGIITIIKRRKNIINLKENILTYGMMFFTIIYFSFIIFTYGKMSNIWDEYSYWSVASKNMFYSNKLITNTENMLTIYPPVPTIWQYYFTKTIGVYSQGIEIFATQILGFALLIPLFEQIKTKRKIPTICLSIIILCIPAIFVQIEFYKAIYADIIIGLLIAYTLYQKYNEKNDKFLILSLILSFVSLSLIKLTGLYISLIVVCVFITEILIKIYREKQIKNIKIKENIKQNVKEFKLIAIIILSILISIIFWNLYIKDMKIEITELNEYCINNTKKITIMDGLKTIKTTIFGSTPESINYDISNRNLFTHVYTKYTISTFITIPIIAFPFLFIAANLLIYRFAIKDDEKIKFSSFVIAILIGLVLYVAFLQLAYLTKFSIEEALSHASLERYINTYYIAMLIFIIYISIRKIEESKNTKNINFLYILLTITIMLITPLYTIINATIGSGVNNALVIIKLDEVIRESEKLKETLDEEDNIYLINQTCDVSVSSWQIKYFVLPELNIKMTQKFNEDLENKFKQETEEDLYTVWKKILYEKYDYVYVYKTDEYFSEFSKEIFENKIIKDMTIYKIEKENNDIRLVELKE